MSLTFTAAVRANKPKRNVGVIIAGSLSSVSMQKNGRVWGWGSNSTGQVGDNSNLPRETPVSVAGSVKTFCHIFSKTAHVASIDKNGKVWCWGDNFHGQLGDNTTVNKLTPVSIVETIPKTFCKITAGAGATAAIDKNGKVWCWGYNFYGQLGDNTTVNKLTPVSIVETIPKTFCKIAFGDYTCFGLDKNGKIWSWGDNFAGGMGDGTSTCRSTPVALAGASKTFCEIAGRGAGGSAIDKYGKIWGWGLNQYFVMGNNDTTGASYFTPISVSGVNKTFCKISTSLFCVLAIDKNGRAWGWGANNYGQIGDNSYSAKYTPVSVAGTVKTFCQINAGYYHSVAVDKNGRAWAWGFDLNGLGTNRRYTYQTPVSVTGAIKTFCKIFAATNLNGSFAGANRACALDKNGMIWSWGTNSENGGLGDNTNNNIAVTPISVVGTLKTFCQISIGGYGSSSAIDKNGRAWCWGLNSIGQLGDGTSVSRLTPVSVIGPNRTFCQISTGLDHTAALDKNGMVWSWGGNRWGAIGNNTITCYCSPVAVGGATKTFCHISAGGRYTAAIDKYGKVWTWGNNYTSQLGDGTTVSKLTPINIAGATKTFCKISAGIGGDARRLGAIGTALAIDKYGMIWGWGASAGAIGDNASIQRSTPVSIVGATKTFCQVSSGYGVSCAIDKNGRAWCWGNNTYGQVGDNSTTCRLTPVSVVGAIKTFCQICAGYNQSYGIDKYGRAWSWGHIGNGALGNGTDFRSLTPIKVCNI